MEAQTHTPNPNNSQDPPNPNDHQDPPDPKYNNNTSSNQTPSRAPPSVTSPSHDFSFTISFNSANTIKCNSPSIATGTVDFSPADDIFFHGHLLPLHLLSHPAIPPRASTEICVENMGLPLDHVDSDRNLSYNSGDIGVDDDNLYHDFKFNNTDNKARMKAKPSLSSIIFGFAKLKKLAHESNGAEHKEDDDKRSKRRKGFDMKRLLKKYVSLMDTIFSFKGSADKSKRDIRRRPYSFSGHSNRRDWEGYKRRKGQFSAPASMRTSPTNSGLLSATSGTFSSSDDSTMEELQSAIQAAIAHCKNSVAAVKEDKCKC